MLLFKNKISKQDIVLGFKKAYSVSFLPAKIEVLYSSLSIRIFRVIGGICLVLVLTGKHTIFYKELQFLILIIALMLCFLIVSISLIKLVYGLYTIIKKPEVFEVSNKPINTSATHIRK